MDTTPNIAPQAEPKAEPKVDAEPAKVAEPVATPAAESAKSCPKKKGPCCFLTVLAAILAIGGIGAAIYFFMDADSKAKENNNLRSQVSALETATTPEPTTEAAGLDKEMVQNIIDPYLVDLGTFSKVFGYGLSEDIKVSITVYNLPASSILDNKVDYFFMNEVYQKLFGAKELKKKDYTLATYDAASDKFTIPSPGWGGTGAVTIVNLKDFEVGDDELTVYVNYDNPRFCGMVFEDDEEGDAEYCVEPVGSSTNATKASAAEFLEKNADKMPVYKMTLKKDEDVYNNRFNAGNGRYVLTDIDLAE